MIRYLCELSFVTNPILFVGVDNYQVSKSSSRSIFWVLNMKYNLPFFYTYLISFSKFEFWKTIAKINEAQNDLNWVDLLRSNK